MRVTSTSAGKASGHVQLQFVAPGLDHRQAGLDGAGQHPARSTWLLFQFELAAADAGDVEQVVDQVHHVADLALHHLAHLGHRGRVVAGQAHHAQAAADRRQRIAQLVRQRGQELGLAAVGLGQVGGQLLQRGVGMLARGDVAEQQRDAAAGIAADARCVDVEPASHRLRAVLEARRLAGAGDTSIGIDPEAVQPRHQFQRRPAGGVRQAGMPLESRVHLDEAVIDRLSLLVEDHVDDAKALVDRFEQGAVALLAGAQFFRGAHAVGRVEHDRHQALGFAVRPAQRDSRCWWPAAANRRGAGNACR
jgi:hypothetical protein